MIEKPPLGLTPYDCYRKLVKHDRALDILNAMLRYIDVQKPIPQAWIKELVDLDIYE